MFYLYSTIFFSLAKQIIKAKFVHCVFPCLKALARLKSTHCVCVIVQCRAEQWSVFVCSAVCVCLCVCGVVCVYIHLTVYFFINIDVDRNHW